ncbi:hypothetical protein ACFPH6_32825 [Streptomyces xiangluensis]|uniref:MYXO-CTERM domain-containing protein n=1 Tax=Streptomyces xiangluensis TaxID=2665720 RepID=A0ABV8YXC0_9ACTN
MISSSWDRSRRIRTAVSVLTVIGVAVGVLVLALSMSVPKAWWPHTGQAFAIDVHPHSAREDPCNLIAGPAKAYCEGGTTDAAPTEHPAEVAGAAWRLVPAGAGLVALLVWRRRSATGQRRR